MRGLKLKPDSAAKHQTQTGSLLAAVQPSGSCSPTPHRPRLPAGEQHPPPQDSPAGTLNPRVALPTMSVPASMQVACNSMERRR